MSAFFPTLRSGELLYSAVARFRDAAGFPSERAVMHAAFGSGSGSAIASLPGRIEDFLSRLPPGHGLSAPSILREHTTFPYYEKFLPAGRARAAGQALCRSGRGGGHAYGLLGLRASTVKTPRRLRYCPACVEEERAAIGFAYWHRACQLPGVLVCPACHEPLHRSAAGVTTRKDVHRFASLEAILRAPSSPVVAPNEPARNVLTALADATEWLLASRSEPPGLRVLRERHHRLLDRRGLLTPGGNVRVSRLREEVVSFYGLPFLSRVGCVLSPAGSQPDDWLARLVRKPRTSHHPLRHLLLMTYLGCTASDFFDEEGPAEEREMPESATAASCPNSLCPSQLASPRPHPKPTRCRDCGFTFRKADRPGARLVVLDYGPVWESELKRLVSENTDSLRSVARTLGVSPKTVQRHARRLGAWRPEWTTWDEVAPAEKRKAAARRTLTRHRRAWRALRAAHPNEGTQALRRRNPAAYSHLYRYDRAWLGAHQPAPKQPETQPSRVDWAERDRMLRKKAERVVANMRTEAENGRRPVHICRTTIARRAGSLAVLLQCVDRLPRSTAFSEAAAESRLQFARRRVRWAARRFVAEGTLPPRWIFVRRAGLRKDLAHRLGAEVRAALARVEAKLSARGD